MAGESVAIFNVMVSGSLRLYLSYKLGEMVNN